MYILKYIVKNTQGIEIHSDWDFILSKLPIILIVAIGFFILISILIIIKKVINNRSKNYKKSTNSIQEKGNLRKLNK